MSCVPLYLLEVNNQSWNKEAMATSGCTNACDIKMGPTGVGLFNGPIHVACTSLLKSYMELSQTV